VIDLDTRSTTNPRQWNQNEALRRRLRKRERRRERNERSRGWLARLRFYPCNNYYDKLLCQVHNGTEDLARHIRTINLYRGT
jgi:hypothetical protein